MTDTDITVLIFLGTWSAFSLARIGYQTKRLAAAVETLIELAQKGRGR